jgi:hypothetical protein
MAVSAMFWVKEIRPSTSSTGGDPPSLSEFPAPFRELCGAERQGTQAVRATLMVATQD